MPWAAPIGLRPKILNMIAAKCVHYEKCVTQMDFQYHPNGWKSSQFSSSEFANLAEAWKFEHKTLSPHHPQSNRKAENAVKICKNLLKKAWADNRDPLLAFLDRRNTPTEGLGTSPVQRLMGRRTGTLLPSHTKLLKLQLDSETEAKLAQRKQKQELQYPARSSDSNETPWWHKMVSWQLRQGIT